MKNLAIALLIGLNTLITGCESIRTKHDYDTGFDFSSLKYYAWIDGTDIDSGIDDLNARRIQTAVNRVLGARGYVEAAENLDFLVAIHAGTRSRVSVSDRYYGRGGWYGPAGVEVYQYEEGMLSIDVVDAKKNELIWRGTATKVLSTNPTPEKTEETIQRAVEKILAKFPPPDGPGTPAEGQPPAE